MKDMDCVAFLRWALPQLHMQWPGFRKVRRQTCKRIERRLKELGLSGVADYRAWLQEKPDEWLVLDTLCRITISRFFRDREVFRALGRDVLPELAQKAKKGGGRVLRCWCAGCASGEEPYTLILLWKFEAAKKATELDIKIIATDIDPTMLERAARACYQSSSLKELPDQWKKEAFDIVEDLFCLRPEFRAMVEFCRQDIRQCQPDRPFQLILCRNLAFTYYDSALQKKILEGLSERLDDGGVLVLGVHEELPSPAEDFVPWYPNLKIYWKQAEERQGT